MVAHWWCGVDVVIIYILAQIPVRCYGLTNLNLHTWKINWSFPPLFPNFAKNNLMEAIKMRNTSIRHCPNLEKCFKHDINCFASYNE
jgi:hypothetical protein